MRFRGTLRSISYAEGVDRFLGASGVRYKDFKEFALGLSGRLTQHAEQVAKQAGRPFEYQASSGQDKQARAEQIAARDGITEGLVCILRCVEPCMSFSIRRHSQGGFNTTTLLALQISGLCAQESRLSPFRLPAVRRQKASPGPRRLVLLVAGKAQNANSDSPKCP